MVSIFSTLVALSARSSVCDEAFQTTTESRRELVRSWNEALQGGVGSIGGRVVSVYDSSITSHSRANGISSAVTGRFIEQVFKYSRANIELRISKSSFEPVASMPSEGASKTYSDVFARFRDFVRERQLKENLTSRGRARSWSEETLKQVENDLTEWADVSKFITISLPWQRGQVGTSHPVIGTLKIVSGGSSSPRRQLPLEREYQLDLPENAGRKFEIGNYAVEPVWNSQATLELFLQLALEAHQRTRDPGHVPGQPLFYIATDPVTARIYKHLGFSGDKAVKDDEGKSWIVLQASAETIFESMNEAMKKPNRLELFETTTRLEGIPNLLSLSAQESAFRFWTLRGPAGEVKVFVSEALPDRFGEPYRRLKVFKEAFSLDAHEIVLPARLVPFTEGMDVQIDKFTRLRYRAGELTIDKRYPSGESWQLTRMRVDRELNAVQSVEYVGQHNRRSEIVRLEGSF